MLIHLVSATSGIGREDPAPTAWENYQKIRKELMSYGSEIEKKAELVVLSKIDLIEGKTQKLKESKIQNIVKYFKKKKVDLLPISSANQKGIIELKKKLEGV